MHLHHFLPHPSHIPPTSLPPLPPFPPFPANSQMEQLRSKRIAALQGHPSSPQLTIHPLRHSPTSPSDLSSPHNSQAHDSGSATSADASVPGVQGGGRKAPMSVSPSPAKLPPHQARRRVPPSKRPSLPTAAHFAQPSPGTSPVQPGLSNAVGLNLNLNLNLSAAPLQRQSVSRLSPKPVPDPKASPVLPSRLGSFRETTERPRRVSLAWEDPGAGLNSNAGSNLNPSPLSPRGSPPPAAAGDQVGGALAVDGVGEQGQGQRAEARSWGSSRALSPPAAAAAAPIAIPPFVASRSARRASMSNDRLPTRDGLNGEASSEGAGRSPEGGSAGLSKLLGMLRARRHHSMTAQNGEAGRAPSLVPAIRNDRRASHVGGEGGGGGARKWGRWEEG